ncbi:MAG: alpha/beta hydrolase-fold protein, partial [Ignavibacteriaceae bacterium]
MERFEIENESLLEVVKYITPKPKWMKKKVGKIKIVGTVKYHKKFKSTFLQNERDIIVWLPPSYNTELEKKYPVLYMHDGQNIMDPKTSFAGVDWRADETATKLIKEHKLNEIIIVGIYNTPDRLEEYSDSKKGENYIKFLIEELKPFIDSNYRTKIDKENTAVMGSSMGGLISFLIVWKYPDVISKAASLSTSFYYDNEKAIEMVKNENVQKNIKVYI